MELVLYPIIKATFCLAFMSLIAYYAYKKDYYMAIGLGVIFILTMLFNPVRVSTLSGADLERHIERFDQIQDRIETERTKLQDQLEQARLKLKQENK